MFQTVKSKLFVGVTLLILSIQVSSVLYQNSQVHSILLESLEQEAQNLVIPLYQELIKTLDYSALEDEDEIREQIGALASVRMGVMMFPKLISAKEKLKHLQFVNKLGWVYGHDLREEVGQQVPLPLRRLMTKKELGSLVEVGKIFVFVPFFYEGKFYGGIICTYSDKYFQKEKNGILLINTILLILYLFIGGMGAWFLSRTIMNPIQHLIQVFERITSGHLEEAIDTGRKDELGILAKSFAYMRDSIRDKILLIEKSNKDLQESLQTLQRTQQQLLIQEKMASLGGLVAGIAHEINTPVGIGVTVSSHLRGKTKTIQQMYEDEELTEEDLEEYFEVAQESTSLILLNLQRSYDLIKSFKQIAVDQSSEARRTFKIKPYLEEIILSLQVELKRGKHEISITCAENIEMDSYPGAFSQIITNLTMNAIIHGFEKDQPGRIEIDVYSDGRDMMLYFSDNGKGIPSENQSMIFDPFFTTRRTTGGSGLGLHLIYTIITQQLGGSIQLDQEVRKGCLFKIRLPLCNDIESTSNTLQE